MCHECHITPDWLLIYEVDGDELILYPVSYTHLDVYKRQMVMVDVKLYYDTGKESTISGRCGVMDGEITCLLYTSRCV